jgi:putative SOS response-associated peptidase YedK
MVAPPHPVNLRHKPARSRQGRAIEAGALAGGLWTTWTSVRKVKEGRVTVDAFAFLTCPPNAEVSAVHPTRCR